MTITIESTTAEKLSVVVTTTEDPTASPPDFSVGTGVDPVGYVPGAWAGSWDAVTGEITAETPLLGEGEALDLATRGTWRLWARWVVGTETPVRLASILRVV